MQEWKFTFFDKATAGCPAIKLKIPEIAKKNGYVSLDIDIPNAASPSSIGIDADTRVLGIGIIAAQFD